MIEKLRNLFKEKYNIEGIDENTKIADLGLDSLGMLELAFHLEEEFNIQVEDEEAMKGFRTIAEVIDYIRMNSL